MCTQAARQWSAWSRTRGEGIERNQRNNPMFSIKFLLAYVRTNTFIPFGIYRIAVALAFAFL